MAHGDTSGGYEKTPGWLDWLASPSSPSYRPPAGAVDAHSHVFGPGEAFPFAPERTYTPCDASADELFALRDHLGFERNVIVQATCHGADNRALVDALGRSGGRARGVATVRPDVTDAELAALHAAGVRGVRFTFLSRLGSPARTEDVDRIIRRIRPLGWHIVVYLEARDLPALTGYLAGLDVPVIIDHMGRPDVSKDPDGEEFSAFLRFLRDNPHVWTKVSCPERLTITGPPARDGENAPYADVIPFARRVVEAFSDRVLWGTDWPHPNLISHMPDDGALVDLIPQIAPTATLRQRLLVDNPRRLYWPEEASS